VFPGGAKGKPLQGIKRFWEDVRAKAELPAVRIHDLRHTFASLLVSGGMTLPMIGKLLGHTRVHIPQRYSHLADGPLRAAVDRSLAPCLNDFFCFPSFRNIKSLDQ
jgi:site-specific recombinase XerD